MLSERGHRVRLSFDRALCKSCIKQISSSYNFGCSVLLSWQEERISFLPVQSISKQSRRIRLGMPALGREARREACLAVHAPTALCYWQDRSCLSSYLARSSDHCNSQIFWPLPQQPDLLTTATARSSDHCRNSQMFWPLQQPDVLTTAATARCSDHCRNSQMFWPLQQPDVLTTATARCSNHSSYCCYCRTCSTSAVTMFLPLL